MAHNKEGVNIEFLAQIHIVMKAHVWHESPSYYQSLLMAYCKYFKYSCRGVDREDKVKVGIKQLHSVMSDMENLQVGTTKDKCILLIEKGRCWSVLSTLMRYVGKGEYDEYLKEAIASFEKLLVILSNQNESLSSLYSSFKSTQGNAEKDQNNLLLTSLTSNKDFDVSRKDRVVSQDSKSDRSFNIEDVQADNHHHYLRDSILDLLCHFAKEGHLNETLRLMTRYAELFPALSNVSPDQSSRIALRRKGAENETAVCHKHTSFSEFMKPMRQRRMNDNSYSGENLSEENQKWIARLGEEIIKSGRVRATAAGANTQRSGDEIFDELNLFFKKMEQILSNSRINTSASMYAARIHCLFENLNAVPPKIDFNFSTDGAARRTQEIQVKKIWDVFLKNAFRIVDSVNDETVGRNSVTYHAIVDSLCKVKDIDALDQAYQVIVEMESEGFKVMPETWACILSTSTLICTEDELSATLDNVERKIVMSSPKIDPVLIRSMMFAHARLNRGLKSLELFQMLRASNSAIGIKVYYWVINALYHFKPDPTEEEGFRITKNPKSTCHWFLNEMHRDGIRADEGIVRLLMKLYMKRCQMQKTRESIDEAQSFIETFTTEGYMDHSRVEGSEEMYSDIIKAACLANHEERALEILESMEMWYNIKPTAISYEPIVYNYSSLKHSRSIAQDILTMMVNQNVKISTNIVDTLVDGYLRPVEDNIEALDLVQDLFNMHAVRPSPSKLLDILDISLRRKDVFEARRVVVVIKQMFESSELPDPRCIPPIHAVSKVKATKYIEEPYGYKATSYLISDLAIEERFISHGLQLN